MDYVVFTTPVVPVSYLKETAANMRLEESVCSYWIRLKSTVDSMRSTQANGTGISRMSSTERTVKNATVQIEKKNTSFTFIYF